MKARWLAWWRLRTLREQRLLLVMAAMIGVVLAWLIVIRPISDRLAGARGRQAEAAVDAARAEALADTIAQLERVRPRRTSAPVAARIASAASAAGLALTRSDSSGNAVTVAIAAARPAALFAWIGRLERDEGLIVDRITTRANADRTLSAEIIVRGPHG